MEEIIIIGAGGHAAEIDDYLQYAQNKQKVETQKIIGFIDDNEENYHSYQLSAPYLGNIKDHTIKEDCSYIIGIANLKYRKSFIEKFLAAGAKFAKCIHPDAYISRSAKIGEGVVIAPNVNLGPNVEIGDFTLLNARCSIGHDTKIGYCNFISPNVCFSGFSVVGNENLFGINSATIPNIKVGDRNKIAAGMVLDKNVADDSVVFFRQKERVLAIPKQS